MLTALQATPTEGSCSRPVPTPATLPYGWRYRLQTRPNGTQYYVEIPLTEEAFLDPQEGDRKMQKSKPARSAVEIFNRLDNYYAEDPTTNVFFDLKMEWGIPGLKNPAPDIAVVPQMREKDPDLGTFRVLEQHTRPALVIEVMSPHYQGDNTVKVKLYGNAGVKEYLVVNPYHGDQRNQYHLTGYRLVGKTYQPIQPESDGRLYSETTGVFFSVAANQQEVILTTATGEKLLTAREERQARQQERQARQQEQQARQQEQQARVAAQAQAEALQRQVAEERAQTAEAKLQELEARLRDLEVAKIKCRLD